MKNFRLSIVLIAGIVVLAAVYVWLQSAPQTAAPRNLSTQGSQRLPQEQVQKHETRMSASEATASLGKQPEPKDIKRLFAESRNYWVYAHDILPAAQAGNADAQFYLSKILEFCDYANKAYFQANGANLTLDQALQLAVERKRPVEVTQAVFERCHEFQAQDATELGSAQEWLAQATQAGQPTAEATTAQKMYSQAYLKSFLKAGASATPENTAPPIGDGADPRDLLLAAVKSLDPEALFAISLAQGAHEQLHPPSDGQNINQLAWMLVACQRGYDCSGNPDWLTTGCPNCGTRSPANQIPGNWMTTVAGDNWPAVQQRAQEINSKLDAGQWDALDLGS